MFVLSHVDHHCGIVSYGQKNIRNARCLAIHATPPAEQKKRTMIVLVRMRSARGKSLIWPLGDSPPVLSDPTAGPLNNNAYDAGSVSETHINTCIS